jgi:hypothetical protein
MACTAIGYSFDRSPTQQSHRIVEEARRGMAVGSTAAAVSQKMLWLGMPPNVSHTVAAATPPGRNTRFISSMAR